MFVGSSALFLSHTTIQNKDNEHKYIYVGQKDYRTAYVKVANNNSIRQVGVTLYLTNMIPLAFFDLFNMIH